MSFEVTTLRALVHAGDKTSGDARCVINKDMLGMEYAWKCFILENLVGACFVVLPLAQLVDTDTESDPKEAPSKADELQPLGSKVPLMSEEFEASEPSGTRTVSSHSPVSLDSTAILSPDYPLTHVSPTPTPTRVSFHRKTIRMAVRTQPTLSLGMSSRIADAAALSPSSFCKRYRSSYETSSSSPTLPVWKRYRGTSALILDTNSEGDELGEEDTKEDEEDESSDADDERESGQGLDDEGHGLGDEDHGLDNESQGLEDEGLGLEEEQVIPEGQQQAVPVLETAVGEDQVPSTFKVGQSSRSVSEQQGSERVSAFRQPTLVIWVDLKDDRVYTDVPAYAPPAAPVQTHQSPTISVDEDQFIKVGAQLGLYESILHDDTQRLDALPPTLVADIDRDARELYIRSGAIRDEIFHRVQQAAIQRELQEMRGRVATLEQERGRRDS
ncbi:hypothetical protein Tco_1172335 [Tanacetum coccineum]